MQFYLLNKKTLSYMLQLLQDLIPVSWWALATTQSKTKLNQYFVNQENMNN